MLWANCLFPQVVGKVTSYMPQSFFFDWTPAGQSPPIPTTAQCDSLHIVWERGNALGPNPTAPYFLQIYTSTFIVPLIVPAGESNTDLIFDFPVPFVPGTQYEICMFDANGFTGGCQAIYTVYPAANTTLQNPPVCTNLTYPQPNQVLGVDAQVDNGPISQFGWVDQCTDIQLTPTNGTPPFTMTVAPALHPPYNITSNTMDPINWTVSLSYGMPFFVSLVDSTGLSWQNGPLHSGGGGTTECLSQTGVSTASPKEVRPWVAAVSGVAGLIVGLLAGLLGAFIFFRSQRRREKPERPNSLRRKSSNMSITTAALAHTQPEHYSDDSPDHIVNQHRMRDGPYQIEPFVMPSEQEFGVRPTSAGNDYPSRPGTTYDVSGRHSHSTSLSQDHARALGSSSPPTTPGSGHTPSSSISPLLPRPRPLEESRTPSQVFVVHHDGGRAPVTVYAANGTEVVELPPQYIDSNASTPGSGGGSSGNSAITGAIPALQFQDRRQPSPMPPKGQRRVIN